ncbi:hypothetical protein NBRC106471_2511 [Acetobacter pasteurianus subsp. pasteurianus LMG 1262 = NBRC 106471]|nr:hypothetical protein NBRC106471_2511 [Acetobacter pasteurianus subsp. pasteurianus LMG 1262 = NBRC 106471]
MGQISMKISALPGSVLSENQQPDFYASNDGTVLPCGHGIRDCWDQSDLGRVCAGEVSAV